MEVTFGLRIYLSRDLSLMVTDVKYQQTR